MEQSSLSRKGCVSLDARVNVHTSCEANSFTSIFSLQSWRHYFLFAVGTTSGLLHFFTCSHSNESKVHQQLCELRCWGKKKKKGLIKCILLQFFLNVVEWAQASYFLGTTQKQIIPILSKFIFMQRVCCNVRAYKIVWTIKYHFWTHT